MVLCACVNYTFLPEVGHAITNFTLLNPYGERERERGGGGGGVAQSCQPPCNLTIGIAVQQYLLPEVVLAIAILEWSCKKGGNHETLMVY